MYIRYGIARRLQHGAPAIFALRQRVTPAVDITADIQAFELAAQDQLQMPGIGFMHGILGAGVERFDDRVTRPFPGAVMNDNDGKSTALGSGDFDDLGDIDAVDIGRTKHQIPAAFVEGIFQLVRFR